MQQPSQHPQNWGCDGGQDAETCATAQDINSRSTQCKCKCKGTRWAQGLVASAEDWVLWGTHKRDCLQGHKRRSCGTVLKLHSEQHTFTTAAKDLQPSCISNITLPGTRGQPQQCTL